MVDAIQSGFGFRLAVFNQVFKDSFASFGLCQSNKTFDPKVEEAINRLNRLKRYIKQSEENVRKMINGMKSTMEAQKQFAIISKDAKLKSDEIDLMRDLTVVGDSLSSNSKDIECLYLPPMENFHDWLKTFLNKAIADAEESVSNYNKFRTEMDAATQVISQTKERLTTEHKGSQEYERVSQILKEHEQTYKIKKEKYDYLCEEVIQKVDLLETKRKADMPNYIQSMYDTMHMFYDQSLKRFPHTIHESS